MTCNMRTLNEWPDQDLGLSKDKYSPDPVYQRPTPSTISWGGDVPQVPAEVAGWNEIVVCEAEGDEVEKGKGTNKKEEANLKAKI